MDNIVVGEILLGLVFILACAILWNSVRKHLRSLKIRAAAEALIESGNAHIASAVINKVATMDNLSPEARRLVGEAKDVLHQYKNRQQSWLVFHNVELEEGALPDVGAMVAIHHAASVDTKIPENATVTYERLVASGSSPTIITQKYQGAVYDVVVVTQGALSVVQDWPELEQQIFLEAVTRMTYNPNYRYEPVCDIPM